MANKCPPLRNVFRTQSDSEPSPKWSGRSRAKSYTVWPLCSTAASPDAVRPLTALLRPPSALLRPLTTLLRLLTVGVRTMLRSVVHVWVTIRESNLRRQIATLTWARSDRTVYAGQMDDNVSWQEAYSCFNHPSARPLTDPTHAERRVLAAHSSQGMQLNARLLYISHSAYRKSILYY